MITEIADTFLQDFGVAITWGAVSAIGIFDMPDQIVGGDLGISTEYAITVEASVFEEIDHGDAITVAGGSYKVREFRRIDDGTFARITLTKTS